MHPKLRFILGLLICSILSGGCKEEKNMRKGASYPVVLQSQLPQQKACMQVVNGQTVTSGYEAVVHLTIQDGSTYGHCTGTFIGRRVILTANHCIQATKDTRYDNSLTSSGRINEIHARALRPAKIIVRELISQTLSGPSQGDPTRAFKDLALLVFDQDVAPAVLPIRPTEPTNGAEITLVGFGKSSLTSTAAPTDWQKRFGTNNVILAKGLGAIEDIPHTMILSGAGDTTTGTNISLVGKGDSGGPGIIEGAVMGVASSGGPVSKGPEFEKYFTRGGFTNFYGLLDSPEAESLFAEAEAMGAKIERAGSAAVAQAQSQTNNDDVNNCSLK